MVSRTKAGMSDLGLWTPFDWAVGFLAGVWTGLGRGRAPPACPPGATLTVRAAAVPPPPRPKNHFRDLSKVLPAAHKARLAPREPFLFLALKMNDF